jgi:hypothetical protein
MTSCPKDTAPAVYARWLSLMMAKDPAERFTIGLRMMRDGKLIVAQSLKAQGLAGLDLKCALARRLYGRDMPRERLEAFIDWLRRREG